MICNKCNDQAVRNIANNKEFYFCRTCRIEVNLEEKVKFVPNPSTNTKAFSDMDIDEFDDWQASHNPVTFTDEEIRQMFNGNWGSDA